MLQNGYSLFGRGGVIHGRPAEGRTEETGFPMKRTFILSSAALALMAAPALAGSAAGCGTNCQLQAELDALRAEVEALSKKVEAGTADKKKFVQSGGTGIELKLSGQINRGVLFIDDGDQGDTFFVDNDNSSTRFRMTGSGNINEDVKAGIVFEVQFESNSTAAVNQTDGSVGPNNFTERKLEWYIDSKTLGRLTVGQGDMASNGTSEVDLSGTDVIAYSAVGDSAGGILFFDDGVANALSVVTVNDRFNNLDGQSRRDRVRYDTPEFAGFKASGSVGEDGRWDAALRYAGDLGDVALEGAIAYSNDNNDDKLVNGSVSALHKTSGLNLTFAAGEQQDATEGMFYYIKGGWQTKAITPLGKTAFAIDYYDGEDIGRVGTESMSYGIAVVQRIDKVGTELYGGARVYEVDEPGLGVNFDDVYAFLIGARIKF